jgi:hypothetical protein
MLGRPLLRAHGDERRRRESPRIFFFFFLPLRLRRLRD